MASPLITRVKRLFGGRESRSGAPDGLTVVTLIVTGLLAAFIALPCAALLLKTPVADPWAAIGHDWVREALALSLKTSVVATLVCVIFGSPAAYSLARLDFAGKRIVDAVLQLPLVLPPVVAGVALLMAFGRRGLLGGVLTAAGLTIPFTTLAVVIDGADNFRAKFALNQAAVSAGIPYIYGALSGSYALVKVILAGVSACLCCLYRDGPDSDSSETAATAGVIAPAAGTVAALQTCEAMKIIVGAQHELITDLIQLDLWEWQFDTVQVARRSDCPVCGAGPPETRTP